MFEILAAVAYLYRLASSLRMRVVNVTDLMILGLEGSRSRSLSHNEFETFLFGRPKLDRITIERYCEEGSTTTPFDMVICNGCSGYNVAQMAIRGGAKQTKEIQLKIQDLLAHVRQHMAKTQEYILATGKDPEGTYDTPVLKEQLANSFH